MYDKAMHKTLYFSIVRMVMLLVSGTAIIMLLAVWDNLSATVHKNIYGTFENVAPLLNEEINNLATSKSSQLTLLLEDSTKHNELQRSEIDAVLKEFLTQLNSDLLFFSAHNLKAKSQVNNEIDFNDQAINEILAFFRDNTKNYSFYYVNERLFWLIRANQQALPKDTYLVAGYELNRALLKTFSNEIRLNLSLVIPDKPTKVLSTIRGLELTEQSLDNWILSSSHFDLFNLSVVFGLQPLYTAKVDIENGINVVPHIYLSLNAERISANFVELVATIAGLSLIAIILAIITAIYKAKHISKPLEKITEYSEYISQGHYLKEVDEKAHTVEFGRLLNAFKSMQQNIMSREKQILHQSQTDALSNLYNRSFMQAHIDHLLNKRGVFQVIGINLVKFREINDVFGYEYGDECLRVIAKRLKALPGMGARLNGGEFLWLPETSRNRQQIIEISAQLEADVLCNGISINISTAIGIMHCPDDADTAKQLFNRVSMVLDIAQKSNKRIETYSTSAENQFSRRRKIICNLKNALLTDSASLFLEYQPQLNLQTGEVSHIEALARWHDDELGTIGPDEFIQIAEDAGFINQLTQWVLRTAMKDVIAFRAIKENISIAINISAQDIISEEFVTNCLQSFRYYALSHDAISFELTESIIVNDSELAKYHLQKLRDSGCKIAIDDFGTGYSSLSYLTTLPIDVLKIDRWFVKNLPTQKCNQWICRRIIALANDFGFTVVAEGIEDRASMRLLRKWGCHKGQGYYISKPMARDAIAKWLMEQ